MPNLSRDLTHPGWIKFKGILFLVLGLTSAGLLLAVHRDLQTGLLLMISIWSFCRFYYFAFYVIEHYVDPSYRFAGLWAFARYMLGRDRNSQNPQETDNRK